MTIRHISKQWAFSPTALALCIASVYSSSLIAAEDAAEPDERMVITATQTRHTELTAPASVTVITSDEIENKLITDIGDIVSSSPGINVLPSASYGRNEISIRGLDSDYTLILVNGRRVNSQEALIRANDFDLSSIPMAAIERIEIIRGPMSSLYGSEALGGVVNVILKAPSQSLVGNVGVGYEVITEGHGGDMQEASMYLSGPLSDTVSANLIVEASERDPWQTDRDPGVDALEKRDAVNVMSGVHWDINDQQTLLLNGGYTDDEREAHWINQKNAPVNTEQSIERYNFDVGHEGSWEWADTKFNVYHESITVSDDSNQNEYASVDQTNNTIDGLFTTLVEEHLVTAGVEYRYSELDNSRDLKGSGSVSYSQSALYIQDEFDVGDVIFTLGGRLDNHEEFGSQFSPRAYLVYSVDDNWVVKGGIGQAFKAPTMLQLTEDYRVDSCKGRCYYIGNPDLDPETSTSYEASLIYQQDNTGVNVTWFHNELEDMIQRDKVNQVGEFNGVPLYTFYNIDEAEIKGAEISGWYDISDALKFDANYTYTDAENKLTGETLEGVPESNFNAKVSWDVTSKLSTSVQYRYIGAQMAGDVELDGYDIVNLGAGYRFNKTFKLNMGINNLTNTDLGDDVLDYGYSVVARSVFIKLDAMI